MRSAAVLSLCLLVAISATAGATAPAAPVGGATDPRIATLTNWLLRLGTNMSHVRLAHTQFGLGVQTTAPIPAGSVVFELPGTAVLNLRYAQRSPLGALINASSGWLDGCEAVVVSMIYERFVRTDSPIAPFLALLPPLSELPPMPAGLLPRSALFGSTAVVVYDTVLPLWRSITANVLRFMDTHAILFPGIQTPQGRRVWEQRATWGLAVLASRTFGQRRGTDPAKCTLAPLAGMMNHHPLAYPLAARPGADKWMAQYAQVAHRDYAAGEEVLTAYDVHTRRKCNANLLVSYGFWLQHPEHECVTVNARFNNTDNLLWPLRVDLVRLVMQNGTLRLQLHSQRPIPQYVLRLARVMAAETQAELSALNATRSAQPLSDALELRALRLLRTLVRDLQQQYARSSTLEQDRAKFAAMPDTAANYFARGVLYTRIGERAALQSAERDVEERWAAVLRTDSDERLGFIENIEGL